jgi:hypothetical protein
MYRTLFDLAGLAIIGWIPLIFLPLWRGTRRLAESAVFPAYLALLYVVGITAVLADMGPAIMGDFGNADGVLRLLQTEGLALVAWIHILAFDQVVGVLIYRDNMRYGYVPTWLQSIILVVTLMLGPVGFLTYYILRIRRRRARLTAWGERSDRVADAPAATVAPAPASAVRFGLPTRRLSSLRDLSSRVQLETGVVGLGLFGLVVAAACGAAALIHGGWFVEPEGRLLDALRFELGSGIFFLTMAALVPRAGFAPAPRRRWVNTLVVMGIYFLVIEAVQAMRGLDPRFTAAGSSLDRALGGLFGLTALLLIVLTAILAARFFRADTMADRPDLRTAIRYGFAAIALSFGVGIAMSALSGRSVGSEGSLMPLHAVGLHGIQMVPLVAIVAFYCGVGPVLRSRLVHAAGVGWLLLCTGLLAQAVAGRPPLEISGWNAAALVGAGGFLAALGAAAALQLRPQIVTSPPNL